VSGDDMETRARDFEGLPAPHDARIRALLADGLTEDEVFDAVRLLMDMLDAPWLTERQYAPTKALERGWRVRIEALARDQSPADAVPDPVADDPEYNGLRRSEILAAKLAHEAEGHTSESTHSRLRTNYQTLIRARRKLGLKPWPENVRGV
jgi:hypothetical protein